MAAIGNILEYNKDPKEDFYAILGCDEHSSLEQIQAEYKVRALQCHPDKNKGDTEADEKFQLLNEAKETLCNPEKKACYDKWKNSGIAMSYKQYLSMKEHVQQSMHWSTPKTKDRMLESGSSGPSSLGSGTPSAAAQRRASEGGANLHWNKNKAGAPWDTKEDAHSEITAKFSPLKNTAKKIEIPSNGGSGPSSLTIAGTPPSYRRASEGGAHLLMKTRKTDASEKSHQV